MDKSGSASVDEYLSKFPQEMRQKLQEIRAAIKTAAPEAEERISYQMPAYFWKGILVYFGGFKDHVSFFPTNSGVEAFQKELKKYKLSNGTIQLPLDQPIPVDLIQRIVKFRIEENKMKGKKKEFSKE